MTKLTEKGILLIVSGPAGTGKGTVVKKVVSSADGYSLSVSATTRSPRVGEEDGVHYHFLTRERFEEKIEKGEMLEYAEYVGNYYGTPKDRVVELLDKGVNVVLEIEVVGAMKVKALMPEAVTVLLLPPDFEILEARLRGRGTNTEEDIQRRLAKAREEVSRMSEYDYVVINENNGVEEAARQICSIVEAEKHKTSRNRHIPSCM